MMTREEMIDAMRRVIEIDGTEEEIDELIYQLKLAAPHSRITELIVHRTDLAAEGLVDEALRREKEKACRLLTPTKAIRTPGLQF
jgi:hypothetical protein